MAYVDEVLADSPAALFTFSETNGAPVSSNGVYTATNVGGVLLNQDGPKGGRSAYFDGVDDRLALHGFPDVNAGGNFTFEVWVKYASFAGNTVNEYPTFSRRDGNGTAWLLRTRGGNTNYNLIESWQNGQTTEAGANYGDDKWHHVVFVSNNYEGTIYVDGVAYSKHYGNPSTGSPGASNPMYLGYGVGSNELYRGHLAFPAYYPHSLSAARVAAHYNAPATSDNGPVSIDAGSAGLVALQALEGVSGPSVVLGAPVRAVVDLTAGYYGLLRLDGALGATVETGVVIRDAVSLDAGYMDFLTLAGMNGATVVLTVPSDPDGPVLGQWHLEALMPRTAVEVLNPAAELETRNHRARLRPELINLRRV